MTAARPSHPVEDRLRALLATEAEDAMSLTDTDAELRRFHDHISSRRSSRHRWAAAAAAAAVATAAGAALFVSLRADDSPTQVTRVAAAGTLADPARLPEALVRPDVALRPSRSEGAFPAAGALWHVARDGTLERIDPATGKVDRVIVSTAVSAPVAEADGLVWFAGGSGERQRFYALDPATEQVVRQTPVVGSARWIAAGPAGLWAVTGSRELTQIDPTTGAVLRTITTENGLYDVVVGRTAVYAGPQINSNGLTVVDVATGRSRLVLRETAPGSMVLTPDGDLWLHDLNRQALLRLDGATLTEQAAIDLPLPSTKGAARDTYWSLDGRRIDARDGLGEEGQAFLAASDDALYASMSPRGSALLLRADLVSGDVTHVFQVGDGAARGPVTVAAGSLWLDWEPGDDVLRRVVEFD